MLDLLIMCLQFIKTGLFAVGGGLATIPFLYDLSDKYAWFTHNDILNFIANPENHLGTFHNTAHQTFMRYIELLEQGFSADDVESNFQEMPPKEKKKNSDDAALYQPKHMTTQKVLETYLYRNLVPTSSDKSTKKQDAFFTIRENVRRNWPDEATLSRMRHRKINVTRKVLILLFLATDGCAGDFDDFDDEEYTQEDAFLDIYTRLDLMLTSCGFQRLDPRSAFDWLILFCISSGDLWDSDERIQGMLAEVFSSEE